MPGELLFSLENIDSRQAAVPVLVQIFCWCSFPSSLRKGEEKKCSHHSVVKAKKFFSAAYLKSKYV